jgi:hypothetical protein
VFFFADELQRVELPPFTPPFSSMACMFRSAMHRICKPWVHESSTAPSQQRSPPIRERDAEPVGTEWLPRDSRYKNLLAFFEMCNCDVNEKYQSHWKTNASFLFLYFPHSSQGLTVFSEQ